MEFKHFDIVSDVSDHHFSNRSGDETCFTNANSSVYRKIMSEWKILKKDLPDTIYVQAYETRIDLLRAVIIGAAGTPYQDGLFFFDIVFPAQYPAKPPEVYYHAHGLRINPNLYATGLVCLSLLNTWSGVKSELWMPKKSTILQLLVSIQGLVLNKDPYYNEPGITESVGSMNSITYAQRVFILSCKTMLYHLQRPPKNFETFVIQHFLARGEFILAAMKPYKKIQFTGAGHMFSSSMVSAKKVIADLEGIFKKMAIEETTVKIIMAPSKSVADQSGEPKAYITSKPQPIVEKPKRKGIWKTIISAFQCIRKR